MAGEENGKHETTVDAGIDPRLVERALPSPGVALVFANRRPTLRLFRFDKRPLVLGRGELADGETFDPAISREHVRLDFDGAHWRATDLKSRNGTFVNAKSITAETTAPAGSLIRVGGALLLAGADITPLRTYGLGVREGVVGGPALRQALEAISLMRNVGMVTSLLIIGESGTGKEIAAKVFHASTSKATAPFTAVNCATIPKELAERLLFGSRRGAFSGATDAPGYVQAAHGGTLFLDEIAELPADVQSKLLRMLETHEVLRLGATSYERVDVRVCAATWRDLRQEVAAGRFRADLYFRIAQGEVRLPALRERIEEIPWHVQQALESCGGERQLGASAGFVEACCLRPWPGNVRELRAEVRRAAAAAVAHGGHWLTAEDLAPTAGQAMAREGEPSTYPEDEYADALASTDGNVVHAARRLGVHRNKVRRWLERHNIDAGQFKPKSKTDKA